MLFELWIRRVRGLHTLKTFILGAKVLSAGGGGRVDIKADYHGDAYDGLPRHRLCGARMTLSQYIFRETCVMVFSHHIQNLLSHKTTRGIVEGKLLLWPRYRYGNARRPAHSNYKSFNSFPKRYK